MLKVIYGSEYGHAKQYAETFARSFKVPANSYKNIGHLDSEDTIIYFGALYAGGVLGLSSIENKFKKLAIVTVGLADPNITKNAESIRRSIQKSTDSDILQKAQIFHVRGGIDYSKLRLRHKIMMKLLYTKVKNIPESEQDDETKTMIKTYGKEVNFVDLSSLEPIIKFVKGLP